MELNYRLLVRFNAVHHRLNEEEIIIMVQTPVPTITITTTATVIIIANKVADILNPRKN
jgi:hypothetical protein